MGLLARQVSQGWKLKFGSRPILSLSVLFTRPALTQSQSIASKKKTVRLNINLMSSLKRTIWMQFSQGTKSNTEPFLKFADQTNQTKTYSMKSIQVIMVFFLGEGEGEVWFCCMAFANSIKLNQTQSKERVWWSLETKRFDGIVWVCVSKVQKKKFMNLYTCCLVFILQSGTTFFCIIWKILLLRF